MASQTHQTNDMAGIVSGEVAGVGDYLIVAPVALALLFGALLLVLRSRVATQAPFAIFGLASIALSTLLLLKRVIAGGPFSMTMGNWLPPFGISFSVDLAGALMAFAASVVALVAGIYSLGDISKAKQRYGFYAFFLLMMAGVNGSFLTGDIFNLYVWFEVLLISSFGLIMLGSTQAQLDGTTKYAFLNLIATTMFLVATGYLYGLLGTLNMAEIYQRLRQPELDGPVMSIAVMYFLAFAMKAAAFPLNFWLPASYHTPRMLVSAIFAGLLTKVGIYALLRVSFMLFAEQTEMIAFFIALMAAATMLIGAIGALAQNDLRRLLSYLVITGIGTMLAGFAIASTAAAAGILVYAVHSMIVMAGLFLATGIIYKMQNSFLLTELGGLYEAAPRFGAAFLILALSVSGLPPSSGFWGKFLLVRASIEIGAWWLAGAILLSGLISTIAIFRVFLFAFWRGGSEGARDGTENWSMAELSLSFRLTAFGALGLLVAVTLIIGLFPENLISLAVDGGFDLIHPQDYIRSVFPNSGN